LLLSDHLVHYNSVIINLSNLIEVAEVVETDLTVHGEEELLLRSATDAHVDVTQTTVHVDKHNIVVEDEQIHN